MATAITFITLIFTPWGVVIGLPLLFAGFLGWAWPRGQDHREQVMVEAERAGGGAAVSEPAGGRAAWPTSRPRRSGTGA